jgi:hypothetical protein
MLTLDLQEFPIFIDEWLRSDISIEQHFRNLHIAYEKCHTRRLCFSISEKDYLLFALRFG